MIKQIIYINLRVQELQMKVFSHINLLAATLLGGVIMLLSCSKQDSLITDNNNSEDVVNSVKTIHYSVSVSQGSKTKVGLNGSGDYVFKTGDKLYIENTDAGKEGDLYGYLTLSSGEETTSATFSGTLEAKNEFTPVASTPLKATLVGTSDAIHTISGDGKTISSTSYPSSGSGALAASLSEAVGMFSNFIGTSTYGSKSFALSQKSSFILCDISVHHATISEGDDFDVTVTVNGNLSDKRIRTSWPSIKPGSDVTAFFVIAYPAETTIDSPSSIQLQWGPTKQYSSTVQFNKDASPLSLVANKVYSVGRIIYSVSVE